VAGKQAGRGRNGAGSALQGGGLCVVCGRDGLLVCAAGRQAGRGGDAGRALRGCRQGVVGMQATLSMRRGGRPGVAGMQAGRCWDAGRALRGCRQGAACSKEAGRAWRGCRQGVAGRQPQAGRA
jgi:hypothetical protein